MFFFSDSETIQVKKGMLSVVKVSMLEIKSNSKIGFIISVVFWNY